jgi:hypothetical protein
MSSRINKQAFSQMFASFKAKHPFKHDGISNYPQIIHKIAHVDNRESAFMIAKIRAYFKALCGTREGWKTKDSTGNYRDMWWPVTGRIPVVGNRT